MTLDWLNVKDFGAVGDGMTDDTAAIQATINAANNTKGVVYIPTGDYKISATLMVCYHTPIGCKIIGENRDSVRIWPTMTGSFGLIPAFRFTGGSGTQSNMGISNLTIEPFAKLTNFGKSVGIYIDGTCFLNFDNIAFNWLKIGVHLHNASTGSFTEFNTFNRCAFYYCDNGVRMEKGLGNDSFHGNDFNNCLFNIGGNNQIGFNVINGAFYYNGRFKLFMISDNKINPSNQYNVTNPSATFVNSDANASSNIGSITIESQAFNADGSPNTTIVGKISGTNRFWFHGFFWNGAGNKDSVTGLGFNDVSASPTKPWTKVFACDNYWKTETYGNSGMQAGGFQPSQMTSDNTPVGFFQYLRKDQVDSVVLNTYNNSDENGLYLGRTGYQQGEDQATLGMFLAGSGSKVKSYNDNGMAVHSQSSVVSNPNNPFVFQSNDIQGLKVFSGKLNFVAQSTNTYQFQESAFLYFSNFISGKIICTSGNMSNGSAPSSTFDIHWGVNGNTIQNAFKVKGTNGSWDEYINVYFDTSGGYRKLRVETNNKAVTEIWFHFQGVKY